MSAESGQTCEESGSGSHIDGDSCGVWYDLTDGLNKAVSKGCASGNGAAVDIGEAAGIKAQDGCGTVGPAAQEFLVDLSGPDDVVDSFDLGRWFVRVDGVFGQ